MEVSVVHQVAAVRRAARLQLCHISVKASFDMAGIQVDADHIGLCILRHCHRRCQSDKPGGGCCQMLTVGIDCISILVLIAHAQAGKTIVCHICFIQPGMHREGIGLPFLYRDILIPHADRSLVAARHAQGTGARLHVISICIDRHFHHIMISRTAFPSAGRRLDDRVFQQLYDVALQLRRVFKAVHMVAAAVESCTERMAVAVVDVRQCTVVVKAVDFLASLVVRKLCTVVAVGK